MKKRILALLLALTLLVLGGCTVRDMVQVVGVSTTTLQELADAALSDETEAPESGDQFVTAESPAETPAEAPQDEAAPADEVSETTDTVGEHTYYYDVDHVVLYLDTYGHLPENYITKDEARAPYRIDIDLTEGERARLLAFIKDNEIGANRRIGRRA